MADLDFTDASQPVEITDGMNMGNSAQVRTGTPTSTDGGLVVREVARGQQTEADSIPVVLASDQPVINVDFENVDSFARIRVANPTTLFSSSFTENEQSELWNQSLTGSGVITRDTSENVLDLDVSASGDIAILQSHNYISYEIGKTQLILVSGTMGALTTNVTQRIGYFDSEDGYFFEQDGTNFEVVHRTSTSGSPVDTPVAQASWNLDPMNGSGSSGITIDTSLAQTFVVDFNWGGTGVVRMGFLVNGSIVYCHRFLNANNIALPSIARPNLPIRFELSNSAAVASTLKAFAASVISDGGFDKLGIQQSVNIGAIANAEVGSGTLVPIISIRLKSANLKGLIAPTEFQLLVVNNEDIQYEAILNPTLGGDSFTSVDVTSISEFDISATTVSGGRTISSGYTTQDQQANRIFFGTLLSGDHFTTTADILTIAAAKLDTTGGGSSSIVAEMTFREIY